MIWLLSEGIRSACLPADSLTLMGFEPLESMANPSNASVCPKLFQTEGICVDEAQLARKLELDQKNLLINMRRIQDLESLYSKYEAVIHSQHQLIGVNFTDYSRQLRDIFAKMVNNFSLCFHSMAWAQMGASCYLASGKASEHTFIEDGFTYIRIPPKEDGNRLFQGCLPIVDAICTFMTADSVTVQELTTVLQLNSTFSQSISTNCSALRVSNLCGEDCERESIQYFHNIFRPFRFDYFPSQFDIGNMEEVYSQYIGLGSENFFPSVASVSQALPALASKSRKIVAIKAEILPERLLPITPRRFLFVNGDPGVPVIAIGQDSRINIIAVTRRVAVDIPSLALLAMVFSFL